MASWAKDSVSAWQRDTRPKRQRRLCYYCGQVTYGQIACADCRDLLKHDPQAKR